MKRINQMLYAGTYETSYSANEAKDKRIVNFARSYRKKGKYRKVFEKTYLTDDQTSAEEIECVINCASILGDINYFKFCQSGEYDRYVGRTVTNQLYQYLKDRIKWEKRHKLFDLENLENYDVGEDCPSINPTLDITDFNFEGLTERQVQAIIYYTYGFKDDYAAEVLGLSKNTVRTHRRNGLLKMRKTNNNQRLWDLSQPV